MSLKSDALDETGETLAPPVEKADSLEMEMPLNLRSKSPTCPALARKADTTEAMGVHSAGFNTAPSQPRGAVFIDPDDMKKKVREALMKPEYNVANFYHKTGIWRRIATHPVFENLTLAVISFNALWIAIDTDLNGAATLLDAKMVFQIVEHFFCWYFSFEWYVRFSAFAVKKNGLKDAWFVFDSCLVFMMVTETWVMTTVLVLLGGGGSASALGNASILRLLRLLRLTRLARMLRSMPELMILIKGMLAASRSVFFTMCLLVILLYLFAIAMRQLTEGTEAGALLFPSVPQSMFKLLIEGVFLDNMGYTTDVLADSSPVFVVVFLIFVSLAALMVMNMLIGVLCEVVSVVAATEKEEMTVGAFKWKMQQVMAELDQSNNGKLNEEEFGKLVSNKDAAIMLLEVGVDPELVIDMGPIIFAQDEDEEDGEPGEGKEIELEEFMNIVLELRDKNTASQKDLKELQRNIISEIENLRSDIGFKKRRSSTVQRESVQISARGTSVHDRKERSWSMPEIRLDAPPQWATGVPSGSPMHTMPSPPLGGAPAMEVHDGACADARFPERSLHLEDVSPSDKRNSQHRLSAEEREVERALEALKVAVERAQAARRRRSLPGIVGADECDSVFASWHESLSDVVSKEIQKMERLQRIHQGITSKDVNQVRAGSPATRGGTPG